MMWLLFIIAIAGLGLAVHNRAKSNQVNEDIDEIRNSIYEIRMNLKGLRAEWNLKIAKIHISLLKIQNIIPQDRMPYYIMKDCIACGSCSPECPVNAISEGVIFEINPEKCIACGKCAKVCPVHACQTVK